MADNSITVPLSKPIITHAGETTEIVLNEPTAGTFIKHGEPFNVRSRNGVVEFDFDNAVVSKFLSEMSGIDPILLSAVRAKDFFALRQALVSLVAGVTGDAPPTEA